MPRLDYFKPKNPVINYHMALRALSQMNSDDGSTVVGMANKLTEQINDMNEEMAFELLAAIGRYMVEHGLEVT